MEDLLLKRNGRYCGESIIENKSFIVEKKIVLTHLGRVGRVEREVVDRAEHADEALEELLRPVELGHGGEEHCHHPTAILSNRNII